METKEATTQILSWGKAILTLSGLDLDVLSDAHPLDHKCEKINAKKVIYGIELPEVGLDRSEYFKSIISSENTTIHSGKRYKVELFPNEILILIISSMMDIKSTFLIMNYHVSTTDHYWLCLANAFLDQCRIIFGDERIDAISNCINKDYYQKEVEMWMDIFLHDRLPSCKIKYPHVESALASFLESHTDLTYGKCNEWFANYIAEQDGNARS